MSEADASADRSTRGWRLPLFESTHPLNRSAVAANLTAGISLAALNIPQAMGYAKIAGMPVITGLYTLLLPVVAFAAFGSSRYLVVASDSATAAILAAGLTGLAFGRERGVYRSRGVGGSADRRAPISGADTETRLPGRFSVAHGPDRVSNRCR